MDQSISLNKFISDTGYCSRREADALITAGRVLINNRTAQLGNRYSPGDQVEVDGSLVTIAHKEKSIYIAFNKPIGITSTSEEGVRDNMISYLSFPKRIFPIGRLDKDSEGLIFLTNDGNIVNKLLRAGNEHEKEYHVRVNKPIAPGFAEQMAAGIPMMGTVTLPCKVTVTGRQAFKIVLTQGLNRQIRRMCEYLGYAVTGLQRVRIMNVRLDKLALGKWRYLSDLEIQQLMNSVKDSSGAAVKNKKHLGKAAAKERVSRKPKEVAGETEKKRGSGRSGTARGATASKLASSKPSPPKPAPPKSRAAKYRSAKAKKGVKDTPAAPIGKYKAFKQKGKGR